MITARTKKQLVFLAIFAVLGMAFVGARYAQLNKVVYDSQYRVVAHFAQSGGIFPDAEVTYRGVKVGKVNDMVVSRSGVNVLLDIENKYDKIPARTIALVGNKSAVGEQYVELQPKTAKGPYLKDGSDIRTADTRVPVPVKEILANLDRLVSSLPQGDLRTVVSEMGKAFKGTGPELAQVIDTSTSFIQTANANYDTTTALLRDSNTVLKTQVDKESAIRSFARDLSLFSGTVAAKDASLRSVIDNGSATANELRTFLEQNRVNLGRLISNLLVTGRVTVRHLDGVRQLLVLYPYVVAGGFTVAAKGAGGYDAHFGLILNGTPPVCHAGYDPREFRTPQQRANKPMDVDAHCSESAAQSNARGAQNAPRRPGTDYRAPVATYDARSGGVTWSDQRHGPRVVDDSGSYSVFGKDAFKWMLLRPTMGAQE